MNVYYYRLLASGNHGCCGQMRETKMKTLRMFRKRERTKIRKKQFVLDVDVFLRDVVVGDYASVAII